MAASHQSPDAADGCVTLYATAAGPETQRALLRALLENGLAVREPFAKIISTRCERSQLFDVCDRLTLSQREQVHCVLSARLELPTASEFLCSQCLQDVHVALCGQWIEKLLDSRGLTTYFQPIIWNRPPFEIFAYECLMRGNDASGRIIAPNRMINAARDAGLLSRLDQMAQLAAIETAARTGVTARIFINFNPRLIETEDQAVAQTIRAALQSGVAPEQFVFEVVECDRIVDQEKLLAILDWFREAGFQVALDDVGAGYSSLNLLANVRPDYVKIDMDLIRGVDGDRYKACVARKLLELSLELRIRTVAEGVETLGEWQWVRDHGADLSQGYLFAKPAPRPPTTHRYWKGGLIDDPLDDHGHLLPRAAEQIAGPGNEKSHRQERSESGPDREEMAR